LLKDNFNFAVVSSFDRCSCGVRLSDEARYPTAESSSCSIASYEALPCPSCAADDEFFHFLPQIPQVYHSTTITVVCKKNTRHELTKVYSCCKRMASPFSSLSLSFRSH